ncbi:hypothetical protein LMH87_012251 [Akanthomyces muscarius]|uniref:Secreted protein n=1 Tax=Akanthomyces muscarius TaxID=2231603 RepID=A0A9W8QDB5_AKAMU|nr:hypothetical protein LMH87_012251 [Akanthomyces muscarius]KAJ4151560.1 hypothetical protein LMH87_012251 [Akanthomyces muscarius]
MPQRCARCIIYLGGLCTAILHAAAHVFHPLARADHPIQSAPACTTYKTRYTTHFPPTPEPNKPPHRGVNRPPCLVHTYVKAKL